MSMASPDENRVSFDSADDGGRSRVIVELRESMRQAREEIEVLRRANSETLKRLVSLEEKYQKVYQKGNYGRMGVKFGSKPPFDFSRCPNVLFMICPLCVTYMRFMHSNVEQHGEFWVHVNHRRLDNCFIVDGSQYEAYPATERYTSWRNCREFKLVRDHLKLCYKMKFEGKDLDDDTTGKYDFWRSLGVLRKENKVFGTSGCRLYGIGEKDRIKASGKVLQLKDAYVEGVTEIPKKRSRFIPMSQAMRNSTEK